MMRLLDIDREVRTGRLSGIDLIQSPDRYRMDVSRFVAQRTFGDYTRRLLDFYGRSQKIVDGSPNCLGIGIDGAKVLADFKRYPMLYQSSSQAVLWGDSMGYKEKFLFRDELARYALPDERKQIAVGGSERQQVFICQPGQSVYGHVLLDIVPRIFIAQQLLGQDLRLVGFFMAKWVWPLFKTIGIDASAVLQLDRTKAYHFDRLFVPFLPRFPGVPGINVSTLKRAWEHFTPADLPSVPANLAGAKRIFISREEFATRHPAKRKAKGRKVKRCLGNEAGLFAIAEKFGFVRVAPEKLSFAEQIALFRQAEFIIGEDGSALHNAVFCKNCRAMVVLMHPERDNHWHIAFAQAGDMDFHAIKCRGADGDFAADEAEFAALLEAICR